MKFFACFLLAAPTLMAITARAHQPKAHTHGHAEISIAFDAGAASAEVSIEVPADAVLGTEKPARTDKERKNQDQALDRLEKVLPKMAAFDAALACQWRKKTLKVEAHGSHADIEGEFKIECQKPLASGSVTLSLPAAFPGLKSLKAQILGGALQTGASVTSEKNNLTLKLGAGD